MCEYAAASDARSVYLGTYSAWLTKAKSDGAKAKWFSSGTKRYFTIDFVTQMFYYSHAEDKKTISQPVRFRDILHAEHLPRPAEANKFSKEHTYGFTVATFERSFELFTVTYLDAQHWVDALNAARDIANGVTPAQNGASDRELSRSSMSTTADGGSELGGWSAGHQQLASQPLPTPGGDPAPWATYGNTRPRVAPPAPLPQRQVQQAPAPLLEMLPPPDAGDPFAALDALEELAGPPPAPEPGFAFALGGAAPAAAMLSHARLLVTNPDAARRANDPRQITLAQAAPEPQQLPALDQFGLPPADAYMVPVPLPGPLAPLPELAAPALAPLPGPGASLGEAPAAPGAFGAPLVPLPPGPGAPQPMEQLAAPLPAPLMQGQQVVIREDSDWDEDPPENRRPVQAAPAGPGPYGGQSAADTSGWDSDDDVQAAPAAPAPLPAPLPTSGGDAPAPPAPSFDACGAPLPPQQTFVEARPVALVALGGDDDLNALMGEMMTNDTRGFGHGLVDGFHCTGCDFQVMRIDEYVWNQDVEYMFFRNNYPTFEKLRRRAARQQGCSAYCCQCSWKSAHSNAILEDVADGLRWRKV